jgi:cytolethal distending toxin subunit B
MLFNSARLRELLVMSFASLLASGAVSLVDISPVYAADERLGTWNMQGSSNPTENKWRVFIVKLLQQNLNVLALQEAGTPPASAIPSSLSPAIFQNTGWSSDGSNAIGDGAVVTQYAWNISTQSRPNTYYIYWANTDPSGNRCNNAIVTRKPAEQVISFLPPGSRRSVIGVRHGSTWYFSVHARSGEMPSSSTNDVPSITQSIGTVVGQLAAGSPVTWVALGDWNQEPASSPSFPAPPASAGPGPRGFWGQAQTIPTYPSTSPSPQVTYDYYWISQRGLMTLLLIALDNVLSDHLPSFWTYRPPQ